MIEIVTRLAEVGKIKAGRKGTVRKAKSGNNYQLPEKTDHWIITTLDKDPTGNFMKNKTIHAIIGDKPKELEIMFLTNDIDEIFPTLFSLYNGKKMICRGDGRIGINQNTGEQKKCPCKLYDEGKCKINGILNCLLPVSNELGGVFRYRTHGFWSVSNILASLKFISAMTRGQLAFIPFILTLSPKKVDKGVIYMANIVYRGGTANLFKQIIQLRTEELNFKDKMENQTKLIDWSNDGSTDKEIAEEFFPDEIIKLVEEENKEIKKNNKKNIDVDDKKVIEVNEIEELLNQAGMVGKARDIYIKKYNKDKQKTIDILKNKIKGE